MPWVPVTGSAQTWSSRATSFAETYTPQGSSTETWGSRSPVDVCRESFAALSAVVESDGRVNFAYLVGHPADWCVSPTTFVVIGSGLTSP